MGAGTLVNGTFYKRSQYIIGMLLMLGCSPRLHDSCCQNRIFVGKAVDVVRVMYHDPMSLTHEFILQSDM